MDLSYLERRQDIRKQAYQPISMRFDESPQPTPAHLVDLSQGGAGIMTTAMNAPMLGQRIDLEFDTFSDEKTETAKKRRESGVVVNIRASQRGIARFGIRFLHRPETDIGLIDPIDPLQDSKRTNGTPGGSRFSRRWDTARGFKNSEKLEEATIGSN